MNIKMGIVLASLIIMFICIVGVEAAEKKSETWIAKQAFQVASQYAKSISCGTNTDQKYLVALVPWKAPYNLDEREDAIYVLVWHGDIGCGGGTGSYQPHVSTVRISTGDSFIVDPLASSPAIEFQSSVQSINSIVKVTKTELTVSALDWGPKDAHCCPSIPVHILLRQDNKGNWKLIEKKRVAR